MIFQLFKVNFFFLIFSLNPVLFNYLFSITGSHFHFQVYFSSEKPNPSTTTHYIHPHEGPAVGQKDLASLCFLPSQLLQDSSHQFQNFSVNFVPIALYPRAGHITDFNSLNILIGLQSWMVLMLPWISSQHTQKYNFPLFSIFKTVFLKIPQNTQKSKTLHVVRGLIKYGITAWHSNRLL